MRSFSQSCLNRSKNSALADRFQQILNEKIDSTGKSLIDQDPTLQRLYSKYHYDEKDSKSFEETQLQNKAINRDFEKKFQKQIGYIKSEPLLKSKDARNITAPWKGSERVQDTAMRMLIDSAPKAKKIKRSKTLFTAPKTFGARVTDAREGSLDYKLSKTLSPEEREKEEFKELYKEKLLGPAMFVDHTSSNTVMGVIGNMASARINATINRKTGQFESPNMESVRGKPLDPERLANSTDSNYFMNQILKKQECVPVWIENQQGIDKEIATFRVDLRKKVFRAILSYLSKISVTSGEEISHYISETDRKTFCEAVRIELMKRDSRYIKAKIEDLNRGVRNYNLLCPSTGLHKWKLREDKEIVKSLEHFFENYKTLIAEHFSHLQSSTKVATDSHGGFLGLFESKGSGSNPSNSLFTDQNQQSERLGFWKSLRKAFQN